MSESLRNYLGKAPLVQCTKCGATVVNSKFNEHSCFVADSEEFQKSIKEQS